MSETPPVTENTAPETQTENAPANIPNTVNDVSPQQWQAFLGAVVEQNNALQAELQTRSVNDIQRANRDRQEALSNMSDKERADALQGQIDAIAQTAQQAQAQLTSNNVWQQRDADAAARVLQSHGLTGNEPELYRASWDANWMPRFAASVDVAVKSRDAKARAAANVANNNPANRANVGGNGSNIPEIDPNATGFDTIRFALSRTKT